MAREVSVIGLDIAKSVFQVHGTDRQGRAVLHKRLRRGQMQGYFAQLKPCVVGIEATQGAHYWARVLTAHGHSVRLTGRSIDKLGSDSEPVARFANGALEHERHTQSGCDFTNVNLPAPEGKRELSGFGSPETSNCRPLSFGFCQPIGSWLCPEKERRSARLHRCGPEV